MLVTENLSLRFGDRWLFKSVSLQFLVQHRYGLIGANGSGKTSFLKVLEGTLDPHEGDILVPNKSKIGTLKQDHFLYDEESIIHTVIQGNALLWSALEQKEKLLQKKEFSEKESLELSKLEELIEKEEGYAAHSVAAKLLEGLGIPAIFHQNPLHTLSGGFKLRVLLAQVLFQKPDILLLDEPTNHLDLFSIKWLEGYLQTFQGVLIVTSHDKDFLNSVCTDIVDVDYGTIRIYKGSFDECIEKKREELKQREAQVASYEEAREKMQGFVDRFGAKASKATQANSRQKMIEKLDLENEQNKPLITSRAYPTLSFELCRPSSQIPLKVEGLNKAFAGKKVLSNISFEIEREERVAIIGPNGIGKSTLLQIITGFLQADSGSFKWGYETYFSYFPQSHPKDMDPEMTLFEWLSLFDRDAKMQTLFSLLGRVLFKGDSATSKKIRTLSGGELSRLILARMMLEKHNVLILDEPTNHLDMESIDALTEALLNYKGTLIFVSHNCFFVSKLANRILEITDKGIQSFKGSYDEYVCRTERDYLSSNIALRLRFSKQYHHGGSSEEKKKQDNSFDLRKKSQNAQKKEREMIKKLEEEVSRVEGEIKKIDEELGASTFYEEMDRERLAHMVKRKEELESLLNQMMEEWERRSTLLE